MVRPAALGRARPATKQAYVSEQIANLLTGQHGRKTVMIFGADLGKDLPLRFAQEIDEAHFGRSANRAMDS